MKSTRLHGGGTALLLPASLLSATLLANFNPLSSLTGSYVRKICACVSLSSTDPPTPKIILFPYPPSPQNFLLTLKPSSSAVNHPSSRVTFHVDNQSDSRDFLDLLQFMSLEQHVNKPTHEKGHILDLIITLSFDNHLFKFCC